MARPASTADLCHVPTPACVLQSLRSILAIPPGCRVLDPCCGTGEAVAALAPNGETYGIELDLARAADAKTRLKGVLAGAMQDARVSNQCFGLVLLNPPYDVSIDGRLERVFLDRCGQYLAPDGVMVLIVKVDMLRQLANRIKTHYDILGHWRFPDPWYAGPSLSFRQTVLVLRRRAQADLSSMTPEAYCAHKLRLHDLKPLPATAGPFQVPLGVTPSVFTSGSITPDEFERFLAQSPIHPSKVRPRATATQRPPPMPLKRGHISMLLASGQMNGFYGKGATRHLARGSVVRRVKTERNEYPTDKGPVVEVVETHTFMIRVRALTPAGVIHNLEVDGMRPEDTGE